MLPPWMIEQLEKDRREREERERARLWIELETPPDEQDRQGPQDAPAGSCVVTIDLW